MRGPSLTRSDAIHTQRHRPAADLLYLLLALDGTRSPAAADWSRIRSTRRIVEGQYDHRKVGPATVDFRPLDRNCFRRVADPCRAPRSQRPGNTHGDAVRISRQAIHFDRIGDFSRAVSADVSAGRAE